MARIPLIAGNWKMNKTAAEGAALAEEMKAKVSGAENVEVLVCPTFTTLSAVASALEGSNIKVGAQNVHWEESGAYTGEISAAMLKEIPVEYVIIGHSERRQYFGETDETVNKRLKAALAGGLLPIVCVGETLEQREGGQTEDVVAGQVEKALEDIDAESMKKVVIAYEPVWAIGTGKTASPEQAQEVHALIRSLIRKKYDAVADEIRLLYGGSMKPGNAAELVGQQDIDGGLIGGASLKAEDFSQIVQSAC